jgi:hypothetical protein
MKLLTKNKYYNSILLIMIMLISDILISLFLGYSGQLLSLTRYLIYGISVYYMLKALIKNNVKVDFLSKVFLLWVLYLIITALPYLFNDYRNYIYLKQFISGTFIIYLYPFFIKADLNLQFYKKIFKLSYLMGLIYLIITVPFFLYFTATSDNGGERMTVLAYGLPILLYTYNYHSKKKQKIIIASALLALVVLMILGRRNGVAFFGATLFFTYLLNFFTKQKNVRKNYALLIFVFVLFALVLGSFYSTAFSYFFERVDTGMDSREGVIELFLYDFNQSPKDWWFGRGIFGEVSGGALGDDETGLRDSIENGYLFLILKGGWIYLGLLILISLKSIYLGLFKSNNVFVKGLALVLIVYYIDMIGFGIPGVYLKYAMVFIAISGCNSSYLRSCSDLTLKKIIGLK